MEDRYNEVLTFLTTWCIAVQIFGCTIQIYSRKIEDMVRELPRLAIVKVLRLINVQRKSSFTHSNR